MNPLHWNGEMKVIDITLDKDKFLQLPELERTLYFALGHAANENNTLAKLLYWSSNAPVRNDAEDRARLAMELLFIQLLAGKLNESWRLLDQKYFGTGLSKTYDPKIDNQATRAFEAFNPILGKTTHAIRFEINFPFTMHLKTWQRCFRASAMNSMHT